MDHSSFCVDKDLEDVMALVRRKEEENSKLVGPFTVLTVVTMLMLCHWSRQSVNVQLIKETRDTQRETAGTLSVSLDVDLGHVGWSCSWSALEFIVFLAGAKLDTSEFESMASLITSS